MSEAHIAQPSRAEFDKFIGSSLGFKRGQWVAVNTPNGDKVGILTALGQDEAGIVATVMLTKEDGTNLLEVRAHPGSLRRAKFGEIPEPRRPALELAQALGYQE